MHMISSNLSDHSATGITIVSPFIAYATDALALGKSFSLLSAHLLSWLHGFTGLGPPDTAKLAARPVGNEVRDLHAQQSGNHAMFAKHCVGSIALTIENLLSSCN